MLGFYLCADIEINNNNSNKIQWSIPLPVGAHTQKSPGWMGDEYPATMHGRTAAWIGNNDDTLFLARALFNSEDKQESIGYVWSTLGSIWTGDVNHAGSVAVASSPLLAILGGSKGGSGFSSSSFNSEEIPWSSFLISLDSVLFCC